MRSARPRLHPLLLLILPLLLTHCASKPKTSLLDYTKVRDKYEAAARADNLDQGGISGPPAAYSEVAGTLTPVFITGLPDPKLKPTAWMMRSVSEWRTSSFSPALSSAGNGISAGPEAGTRDHILLLMLPALVADSELVRDWQAAGQAYDMSTYPKVERGYSSTLNQLAEAEAAFGPSTSGDTKVMFYLHKKRLLLNWDKIIRTLKTDAETQKQAKEDAGAHLGVPTLFDAVTAVNTKLAVLTRH